MNRIQIEKQLIDKATQNPAFRQALTTDPRTALEKELGIKVPTSMNLEVIEESANSLCLVLPAPQGELSDMELESVAGGKGGDNKDLFSPIGDLQGQAPQPQSNRS